MAPRVIRKKAAARTRSSAATKPATGRVVAPKDDAFSSFASTKEDKRRLKHSSLVSRIEKANAKSTKRRRPSKKLATTLESLADALPDMADKGGAGGNEDAIEGARIRHASLKSRPGALKRKEKLEGLERERFAMNMAQMAKGAGAKGAAAASTAAMPATGSSANDTSSRWAALRGHIQSTMDSIDTAKGK